MNKTKGIWNINEAGSINKIECITHTFCKVRFGNKILEIGELVSLNWSQTGKCSVPIPYKLEKIVRSLPIYQYVEILANNTILISDEVVIDTADLIKAA